jgi:hypothetical protein
MAKTDALQGSLDLLVLKLLSRRQLCIEWRKRDGFAQRPFLDAQHFAG